MMQIITQMNMIQQGKGFILLFQNCGNISDNHMNWYRICLFYSDLLHKIFLSMTINVISWEKLGSDGNLFWVFFQKSGKILPQKNLGVIVEQGKGSYWTQWVCFTVSLFHSKYGERTSWSIFKMPYSFLYP